MWKLFWSLPSLEVPQFQYPGGRRFLSSFLHLYRANGLGHSGGQAAGGDSKASPRLKQPLSAVPALRDLESACRVSILCDAVMVPTVCF